MTKYIWATDIAQFEVDELSLKKFTAFDTQQDAYQDAVSRFQNKIFKDCDIIVYIAELDYDDLVEENFLNEILTNIEVEAFQDYGDYDLHITSSNMADDPKTDIVAKYNNEIKKNIRAYLAEIGKSDDVKYPQIVNVQTRKI